MSKGIILLHRSNRHNFNIRFVDEQPTTMKRNDSPTSIDNQATKKPRTLSASDKYTDSASTDAASRRSYRPGPFDVICGRGRPYQEHLGNKRLHEIASVHKPKYLISKRRYKKGIAEMIVTSIKNDETQPGRFLKRNDDENDEVWEDVSDEVAREKVSHVLRFKNKSSEPPSETSSESGASGILRVNNQSSMVGLQSNLATGQQTLEQPHRHPQEPVWNSMALSAFGLPVGASNYASAVQPASSTLNVQQRTLLNRQQQQQQQQRPIGGFDMLSQATGGTAMRRMSSLSVGTAEAPTRNFSETSPVNLLSDDQVFLLEALIQRRRRARTNPPGSAPAAPFP
jgi:hypothetical protein